MQFKFPDVGEGIHEGTLVNWLVKVGDSIKIDQAICEVETDKAIVEIPSPFEGTLKEIFHKEGDLINVGEVLAEFETTGSNLEKKEETNENVVGNLIDADNSDSSNEFDFENYQPKMELSSKKIFENTAQQENEKENSIQNEHSGKVIKLNKIKQVTAKRMSESLRNTAQVTQFADLIVDNIIKERTEHKEEAKKRGVKLTFLSFIIKAYVQTLEEFPRFNANLNLSENQLELNDHISIAIAVNTDQGLFVPVIKNAQKLSVEGIASFVEELASKARSSKLIPEEMTGQTATVTNYGSLGSKYSTPVLNTPDLINLGIGSFEEKIYMEDEHIKSHTIAPISLTFDHQAIDGAEAVIFLNKLQENFNAIKY